MRAASGRAGRAPGTSRNPWGQGRKGDVDEGVTAGDDPSSAGVRAASQYDVAQCIDHTGLVTAATATTTTVATTARIAARAAAVARRAAAVAGRAAAVARRAVGP